jgi:hypothetical protein
MRQLLHLGINRVTEEAILTNPDTIQSHNITAMSALVIPELLIKAPLTFPITSMAGLQSHVVMA